jgi:Cu(I)/Ag(I) efflux system membrane protein CusA/SilA
VRQYQVNVDPNRLRAYGLSISQVVDAVRAGNTEVGGRLIEFGGSEYMVRGRGYARSIADFENIALTAVTPARRSVSATSVKWCSGPRCGRGASDLDGGGETVSGIVIMRHGRERAGGDRARPREVAGLAGGLPPGVKVVPIYDRSKLIERSVSNLRSTSSRS